MVNASLILAGNGGGMGSNDKAAFVHLLKTKLWPLLLALEIKSKSLIDACSVLQSVQQLRLTCSGRKVALEG
jgi:hypothetical protein